MKNLVFCSLVLLFISCSETKNMSPSETTKIVVESFYAKDNSTLKKHTTSDGYDSLLMIQGLVPDADGYFGSFCATHFGVIVPGISV
jgi:hypothetical protein